MNETAYLVGFSDAAAFSRAFKRWTGSSPGMSHASNVGKVGAAALLLVIPALLLVIKADALCKVRGNRTSLSHLAVAPRCRASA